MSIERATGLVLRTLAFSETSLIVRWLTPSWGRISTIAKGARRPKSPFRGKLDLFYEADFTFNRSRSSTLHVLREVVVRDVHAGLRNDYRRLCQAAYCACLIERAAEEEAAVPAFYALLRDLVAVISSNEPNPLLVMAFELKLLTESGLCPNWATSGLRPAAERLGKELLRLELASVCGLQFAREAERDLASFLKSFLQYHLGRVPSGRESALLENE